MNGSEPDFELGGFSLWVHGWDWSDDWLNITARYRSHATTVTVGGGILLIGVMANALAQFEKLYRTLAGTAEFESSEPGFKIQLSAKNSGRIEMIVEITPDQLGEHHTFRSQIDQTYLPRAMEGMRKILAVYPSRGQRTT